MKRFDGKVAIVTGAGQGLGAQYAKDFAADGAQVIAIDMNPDTLKNVKADIEGAGGKVDTYVLDITDYDGVVAIVDGVAAKYGSVDILINNAAVHRAIEVAETSKADWDLQINVDLNGSFYCTRAVLPYMKENKYGKIINISSASAKVFFPGFGAYAAAKGGLVSFTKTLSEEVKFENINVNAVYLGMINTEYTRARMAEHESVTIPLEEMMQPPEVSKVITWLASDDAAPIKGAAIDVFGNHY
jgi:NAD(P)-dependent dehydrogenase (short-subunit alcohol dehydrogenase family)